MKLKTPIEIGGNLEHTFYFVFTRQFTNGDNIPFGNGNIGYPLWWYTDSYMYSNISDDPNAFRTHAQVTSSGVRYCHALFNR
jgi:hypothetical protein